MAKGTPAKGKGTKATPAKPAGKVKAAPSEQPQLDLGAESSPGESAAPKTAPMAAAPPPKPAADQIVVVELVNGIDGVWKKLSNGKRVDLTTKEWRNELTRLFTRAPAP